MMTTHIVSYLSEAARGVDASAWCKEHGARGAVDAERMEHGAWNKKITHLKNL